MRRAQAGAPGDPDDEGGTLMNTGNDTDERDPYAPPPRAHTVRPPRYVERPERGRLRRLGRLGAEPGAGAARPVGPAAPGAASGPRPGPRDEQKPADPRRRNARIAMWLGPWALLFGLMVSQEIGIVMGVAAVVLGAADRCARTPAPRVGPRVEQGPGGTAHHPGRRAPRRPPRRGGAAGRGARHRHATAGRDGGPGHRAHGDRVGASAWSFRWSHQDYYDCMDAALTEDRRAVAQAGTAELPAGQHQRRGPDAVLRAVPRGRPEG
ncbi:hypothetical protein ACU686_17490 [Yinghuangia aomiensis]